MRNAVAGIFVLLAVAVGPVFGQLAAPPADAQIGNFGDAVNVRLLVGLADSADATVRARVAHDLGDTHNRLAIEHVRKLTGDKDVDVRIAAMKAMIELQPTKAKDVLTGALQAEDRRMVYAALRQTRRYELRTLAGDVAAVLDHDHLPTKLAALAVLNDFRTAADAERLGGALRSSSPALQAAAARNAIYLENDAPIGALTDVAKGPNRGYSGRPDPRSVSAASAAIAALGKFALEDSRDLIDSAPQSDNAQLRAGAVTAYGHAGRTAPVRKALKDKSSIVRLAAIKAAGMLGDKDAVDNLVDALAGKFDDQRAAAVDSLAKIGGREVQQATATKLGELLQQRQTPLRDTDRERDLWTRSVAACCRLLGRLNSSAGMDERITLIKSLRADRPLLADVIESLPPDPPQEVIALVSALTKKYAVEGRKTLTPRPMDAQYDEDVVKRVIDAVGHLKMVEAAEGLVDIATTRLAGERLGSPVATALKVLPVLIAEGNRTQILETVEKVLGDKNYRLPVIYYQAARSAGLLKAAGAVDELNTHLTDWKLGPKVMYASAWAIQEITGQTPEIGQPQSRQGYDWIIRKSDL
ncbi:MAG: HEAT repeat domain-containing protein [Phycisphaerae bacterium]